MRGIGTVIFVGFVSALLFGIVAPAVVEPIAQVFVQEMPQGSAGLIDANSYANRMLDVVLVYAPLIVVAVGILSAVVYYLRRESRPRRVR
jgi:hypothetical protein